MKKKWFYLVPLFFFCWLCVKLEIDFFIYMYFEKILKFVFKDFSTLMISLFMLHTIVFTAEFKWNQRLESMGICKNVRKYFYWDSLFLTLLLFLFYFFILFFKFYGLGIEELLCFLKVPANIVLTLLIFIVPPFTPLLIFREGKK